MYKTEMRGNMVIRYTCAETAQFVRKALHSAFPGVKFSVRSRTYSGGASIDVTWTDGPSSEGVEAIVGRFAGATFDGMIDLKEYREALVNGQRVHYGADYVHTQRYLSGSYLRAVAERVARYYQLPVPVIHDDGIDAYVDRTTALSPRVSVNGRDTLGEVIMQRAWETAAPVRK